MHCEKKIHCDIRKKDRTKKLRWARRRAEESGSPPFLGPRSSSTKQLVQNARANYGKLQPFLRFCACHSPDIITTEQQQQQQQARIVERHHDFVGNCIAAAIGSYPVHPPGGNWCAVAASAIAHGIYAHRGHCPNPSTASEIPVEFRRQAPREEDTRCTQGHIPTIRRPGPRCRLAQHGCRPEPKRDQASISGGASSHSYERHHVGLGFAIQCMAVRRF